MTKPLLRWSLVLGLALGAGAGFSRLSRAESPAVQQTVAVDQLKSDAFLALRAGQFDKTNELLARAAELSTDPVVKQMSSWLVEFEAQRGVFVAERRKQYQKAVDDVQKLLDHGYTDYALDPAARAYLLADDKKAFHEEKWVKDLIAQSVDRAKQHETKEQWVKALRLYSDLGSIEPANPLWKEKLKTMTRHVRLLATYVPDEIKKLQNAESEIREKAEALIKPATQPSTRPAMADKNDEEIDPEFRIDWRETLAGVKMDMLWDAMENARVNYYKNVDYRDLMVGGLRGLSAIATTNGLDKAFPTLGDANARAAFIKAIEEGITDAQNANAENERFVLRGILANVRAVNDRTLKLPEEVLVSEFADGAFSKLDPFSSMIWPYDVAEFQKTTQGEFSGVGIQIQSDDDGNLRVVSPLEDSPAYKAGIKAEDVVTHIDGKKAKGISINQAVKSITGPSGTSVTLTVKSPDGHVKDYKIVRQNIKVASVKGYRHLPGGGWDYFVDPENKIGYLRMTNFSRTTSDELAKAVDDMEKQGAKGMILDLRYNPGGLLPAATEVSDQFLDGGTIVSTRADRDTPNRPTETRANPDNDIDLPTVVLINQYSASASEIVSGALKDQKRALLVGERTFGKGSVQMLFPLSDREAYLKLTTSHYYLPSGKCIHREENSQEWGVDPDVVIEMTPEQMRAAIDARQEMDVLRDAPEAPAANGVKKDLLKADPQLSAALLLLRMQVNGAPLMFVGDKNNPNRG